jgi:hydroxymethylbilane synthase
MGWADRVTQIIPVEIMLPAIGQGALAIELRRDDEELRALLCFMNHDDSRREVRAERAFLKVFGGGCQLPIAAYGKKRGEEIVLSGLVGNPDGTAVIRDRVTGPVLEGETLGRELAERILAAGGRKILEEVYCKT